MPNITILFYGDILGFKLRRKAYVKRNVIIIARNMSRQAVLKEMINASRSWYNMCWIGEAYVQQLTVMGCREAVLAIEK